jgi:hypothetical protein
MRILVTTPFRPYPDLYDLIVTTDKLSIDQAAEVVTAFLTVSRLQ